MKKYRKLIIVPILVFAIIVAAVISICKINSAEIKVDNDIDNMISEAIIQHNDGRYLNGMYACESHHIYTSESDKEKSLTTYYILAVYNEYNFENGTVESISGGCAPVAVTFKTEENGGTQLYEYWEPQPGVNNAADIADKFPANVNTNDAELSQDLEKSCDSKAESYFKNN